MKRGVILLLALIAAFWFVRERQHAPAEPPVRAVQESGVQRSAMTPMGATPAAAAAKPSVAESALAPQASLHARLQALVEAETGAQDDLLRDLLAQVTDENVASVVGSLTPAEYNTAFATAALQRWLRVDPLTAAQWIAAKGDMNRTTLVAHQLAATPTSVAPALATFPDGAWKQQVIHATSLELAGAHPAEAIAVARQITDDAQRANALETITYDWCSRDPMAASAWLLQGSDAKERTQLCTVAAKAIAVTDPDLAASWLASLKNDAGTNDTALCLADLWAERAPARAADWAASLAGKVRITAIERVVDRWMSTDRSAATEWLRTQPDGNALLAEWIKRATDNDPPVE